MTPVVIDASAGVELVVDSERGRAYRRLVPDDALPWVPDHLFAECGAVLRRWDLNGVPPGRSGRTSPWPLYVALAAHLHASPLSCDGRLVNVPTLGVPVLYSA